MNSICLPEILVANGCATFMLVFLLFVRVENKDGNRVGGRIYDLAMTLTVLAAIFETASFMIDGVSGTTARAFQYFFNAYLLTANCAVGFLWCLYVDFRMYRSFKRLKRTIKYLMIPLLVDIIIVTPDFFGFGNIFGLTENNEYFRGRLNFIVYIILSFYFIYSIIIAHIAKYRGKQIQFFPVWSFVFPCALGVIIQGFFYGISLGWLGVAIAFVFVHIQIQNHKSFVDGLSGLFNRKYLEYSFSLIKSRKSESAYGIMIDVNGFKSINDNFGHAVGDEAIKNIGIIISEVVGETGVAVRFAGDEFVILLPEASEADVTSLEEKINARVERFNATSKAGYKLSLAMGYGALSDSMVSLDDFLKVIDMAMYKNKEEYYKQNNRRHN